MQIVFTKNGLVKKVKKGYSWTTFFFGGLNLIFARGEVAIGVVLVLLSFIAPWIPGLLYGFFANKRTAQKLIEEGWKCPNSEEPFTKVALLKWGIIA